MKRIKLLAVLVVLWGLVMAPALAQGKWELQKNEDGIEVYTRKVKDTQFKEIRVVCDLPGTPNDLFSLLKDVEHHSDWVYLNRKTKLIKRKSEHRLLYYTEADMPWPLTDRDMVVEAVFMPAYKPNVARVEVKSVTSIVSEKPGFVRIPYSLAVWDISPVSGGRTKIDYTFRVNPGGAIPAWMVNATVAIGPVKTFQNLRNALTQRQKEPSLTP
ncbi:START domain-containing protein [Rufibacter sediminis]|uniref:START domain-containing protein n=1 Tax=Rufibacter sediminis TaxID=2762756 RepID=A0ABR6VSU7_9BACT|nr:START domain-containing protein [Rufibacter sediminis]MBC3540239.1 hypothetical protein [Rufibacter sediminis]